MTSMAGEEDCSICSKRASDISLGEDNCVMSGGDGEKGEGDGSADLDYGTDKSEATATGYC